MLGVILEVEQEKLKQEAILDVRVTLLIQEVVNMEKISINKISFLLV